MDKKNLEYDKVIFLDVDGVLNSQRSLMANGRWPNVGNKRSWHHMDHLAVSLVRGLSEAAKAPIVMSSAWRVGDNWEKFAEVFKLNIIDKTGSESGIRGNQIKAWLDAHPQVKNYIILDDSSDMLSEQIGHFVMVDPEDGLRVKDMDIACKILGITINDVKLANKNYQNSL